MTHLFEWLGLSGVIALVGVVFSHGKLSQRVTDNSRKTDDHSLKLANIEQDLRTVVRVDERTKSMQDDIRQIKESLRAMGAMNDRH